MRFRVGHFPTQIIQHQQVNFGALTGVDNEVFQLQRLQIGLKSLKDYHKDLSLCCKHDIQNCILLDDWNLPPLRDLRLPFWKSTFRAKRTTSSLPICSRWCGHTTRSLPWPNSHDNLSDNALVARHLPDRDGDRRPIRRKFLSTSFQHSSLTSEGESFITQSTGAPPRSGCLSIPATAA